jgi:hypothetical protein
MYFYQIEDDTVPKIPRERKVFSVHIYLEPLA